MISTFQSQKFGFGYPLPVPYLQTINEYPALYSKYFDIDTSTTILGHTHKQPIIMERITFCQDFEYGTSAKLYWIYDWMVLQLDDCIEILMSLHPSIYFIFLFDHPRGHDRESEDRLNITNINSGYEGSQREIHSKISSSILVTLACIGKFLRKVMISIWHSKRSVMYHPG